MKPIIAHCRSKSQPNPQRDDKTLRALRQLMEESFQEGARWAVAWLSTHDLVEFTEGDRELIRDLAEIRSDSDYFRFCKKHHNLDKER